jgi:L-fucose isomerase-like protein
MAIPHKRMMEKTPAFGLITGSRGFFNPKLAANGRSRLCRELEQAGYNYYILPESATPNGAVETLEDAVKYANYFQENRDDIDGIIVTLPNFGDEQGVVETINRAGLDVPVLIHAFDDRMDRLGVDQRRDAFCGKLSVCNNLYQYGIPFTNTTYHTEPAAGDEFRKDLDFFAAVCRTVGGLRNARIAQIGTRPAAFQTVRYSEKLFQQTGVTVVPVDLSVIISEAEGMDDNSEQVKQKIEQINSYGKIPEGIGREKLARQAKLSAVIEAFVQENGCDASAVQCWDSIQLNYGCAACLAMSMMGENKLPSACEVDIAGAVSMYTLLLATGNAPGFLDWNNNFGEDREMCINTHCSNYPKSFVGGEIEISNLDILGATLGPERCFGAIKGKVNPGPMTFFRVSTFDTEGKIKAYVGEGEFTDDTVNIQGGYAVNRIPGLQSLMNYICRNGFEHHVAQVRGHAAKVIEEAAGNYLGWSLYRHLG